MSNVSLDVRQVLLEIHHEGQRDCESYIGSRHHALDSPRTNIAGAETELRLRLAAEDAIPLSCCLILMTMNSRFHLHTSSSDDEVILRLSER